MMSFIDKLLLMLPVALLAGLNTFGQTGSPWSDTIKYDTLRYPFGGEILEGDAEQTYVKFEGEDGNSLFEKLTLFQFQLDTAIFTGSATFKNIDFHFFFPSRLKVPKFLTFDRCRFDSSGSLRFLRCQDLTIKRSEVDKDLWLIDGEVEKVFISFNQFNSNLVFNKFHLLPESSNTIRSGTDKSLRSSTTKDWGILIQGSRFKELIIDSCVFEKLVWLNQTMAYMVSRIPNSIISITESDFHFPLVIGPDTLEKFHSSGNRFMGAVQIESLKSKKVEHRFEEFFTTLSFIDVDTDTFSLTASTCNSEVTFGHSLFNFADFGETVFNKRVTFDGCTFNGELDIQATKFNKGLDLRWSHFFQLKKLVIDKETEFEIGKFLGEWDQIKGRSKPKIGVDDFYALHEPAKNNYKTLKQFYNKLRDNYLAQGDKTSADEVMYELAWQRDIHLQEFWWKVYGWTFGWGYRPWKFLLYVVFPIILIFTFIWYRFYYGLIFLILNEKIQLNPERKTVRPFLSFQPFRTKKTWTSYSSVPFIYKFLHTLSFSADVLLRFRWKSKWSDIPFDKEHRYKSFPWVVGTQFFLGFGLYIAFAILVKGSSFQFIKGLFGF